MRKILFTGRKKLSMTLQISGLSKASSFEEQKPAGITTLLNLSNVRLARQPKNDCFEIKNAPSFGISPEKLLANFKNSKAPKYEIAEKLLKALGFVIDRQKGSHAIFENQAAKVRITIPVHKGDVIHSCKKGQILDLLHQIGVISS